MAGRPGDAEVRPRASGWKPRPQASVRRPAPSRGPGLRQSAGAVLGSDWAAVEKFAFWNGVCSLFLV